MTIDEAIEVLEVFGIDSVHWKDLQGENALELAIEALKYVKTSRDPHGTPAYNLLPGETRV